MSSIDEIIIGLKNKDIAVSKVLSRTELIQRIVNSNTIEITKI